MRQRLVSMLLAILLGMAFLLPGDRPVGAAAAQARHVYPTGLIASKAPAHLSPRVTALFSAVRAAGPVGDTANFSQWDPPTGNQAQVGSCVSWAEGYYYRYWLEARDAGVRITDSFAPMYLYSRAGGHDPNAGSSFEGNFAILQSEGIAPADQYERGLQAAYYDYADDPTQGDHAAAAPYMIRGYSWLFTADMSGDQKVQAVKDAFAAGQPVLLGIKVWDRFEFAATEGYSSLVQPGGITYYGQHALFAPVEDSNGVWVKNQWSDHWGVVGPDGTGGWIELSWAFIASSDDFAAYVMFGPDQPAPIVTPLPTATALPTLTPTSRPTATPRPTSTSQPTPTATPKHRSRCRPGHHRIKHGQGRCVPNKKAA